MQYPLEYFETNITGLNNVLLEMQAAGVEDIIYSSSATVYGGDVELPSVESAQCGATNPYGFTKLTCERMLEMASISRKELNYGILRYFNPVGADASGLIGEDPEDTPNNLMPIIAAVAAGKLDKVSVFGNNYDTKDGTGVRDYIHVSDLAAGHVLSLRELLVSHKSHTVNLGTGLGYSVLELIKAYEKACGHKIPFVFAPRREGDIAEMRASVDLAKDVLGFETTLGLDEMCQSSWNWINTGAKDN